MFDNFDFGGHFLAMTIFWISSTIIGRWIKSFHPGTMSTALPLRQMTPPFGSNKQLRSLAPSFASR